MQHKRILTAIVAVILIAGGVFGGFKLRDTFFSPSGNYQGTTNQLQEPEKVGIHFECPQYGCRSGG